AAAEQPHAGIQLDGGPRVAADRVAAVLGAQSSGEIGPGRAGARAWIEAMLGLRPRPEMAEEQDLLAEDCAVAVVAFGKELLLTSPAGATFLLTEARARAPESVCLRLADGEPITVGELVGRLLREAGEPSRGAGEFAAPGCPAWLEDDDLVIELPEVGPLHLVQSTADDPPVGLASIFVSSGETAIIDELIEELDRPAVASAPTVPEPARAPLDAPPPQVLPLQVDLPEPLAAARDEVVLVVVRGLPETVRVSAGVPGGDGSWLLSPRSLFGLCLAPAPGPDAEFSLEVVAIALSGRDGGLTRAMRTVTVPQRPAAVEIAPAPIPLGLDAEALCANEPFDAIIVLDVPGDATLSAGTYDPEIDAWVLLPRQLSELAVLPARRLKEDFTLSLLGVNLKSGGREGPRVLAQVPISVG